MTLCPPDINRWQKRDKGLAEWLPERNRCWFVDSNIRTRRRYGLTIEEAECEAAKSVLRDCGDRMAMPSSFGGRR